MRRADELRLQLSASLTAEVFAVAHAKLQEAANSDGGDDDALAAGEVQAMLGERFRESLPLMLKLIFLEESSQRQSRTALW